MVDAKPTWSLGHSHWPSGRGLGSSAITSLAETASAQVPGGRAST
jgi:hypothetical protein